MTNNISILYFTRIYQLSKTFKNPIYSISQNGTRDKCVPVFFLRKYNTEGGILQNTSSRGKGGMMVGVTIAIVHLLGTSSSIVYIMYVTKKKNKNKKHRCYYCTAARRRQPVKLARRARVPPASILLYYCRSSHETL